MKITKSGYISGLFIIFTIFLMSCSSNTNIPSNIVCVGERSYDKEGVFYTDKFCYDSDSIKRVDDNDSFLDYNIVIERYENNKFTKELNLVVKTDCANFDTRFFEVHWYSIKDGKKEPLWSDNSNKDIYPVNDYFNEMEAPAAEMVYERVCSEN